MSGNNLPRIVHFDPWQIVLRHFTTYSRLLILTAFVVDSRVGCLGVNGVYHVKVTWKINKLTILINTKAY